MELVLHYTGRWRPIISVPYAVGMMQGLVLEQLPLNLFTLTRAQVGESNAIIIHVTHIGLHATG